MPENWKTYKLKDIATLQRGFDLPTKKRVSGNVPIVAASGIGGYHNQAKVKGPGVITGRSGTIGKVMFQKNDFWPLNTSLWVKDFHGNDVRFIYYLLSNFDFTGFNNGTSVPTLNRNDVHSVELNIPELQEQKSIASILSALDDKIELNLRMNKTLEEMAMTLYKHWFVDFGPFQDGEFIDSELGKIPKGWEVKRLDEISFVKGGKRLPKGAQLQSNPNSHPYLRVKDFNSTYLNVSGMEYVPDDVFNSISNYTVNTGDITLSIVGTIGKVALIGEDLNLASLTENCVKITPKTETIFSEIIYLQLTSKNGQDEIQSKTVGSTQPKLPIYNINSLNLAFPTDFNEVKKVAIELQNWFKIIFSNTIENETLTQLRDTLLPKLISGEVRVKDVEKTLSEVL